MQLSFEDVAQYYSHEAETYRQSKKALRKLEKQMEKDLLDDPEYVSLISEEKELKKKKSEISSMLSDIKQQKELMVKNSARYKEVQNFEEQMEVKFNRAKEKIYKDLEDSGVEVDIKPNKLSLIIAR